MKKLTPKEAYDRMNSGDDITIIDVRTEGEYEEKHIKEAVLLTLDTIGTSRPDQLPDLNAEILVYCRSGVRSAAAAKKLADLGYTNVNDFGGIIDWPYDE